MSSRMLATLSTRSPYFCASASAKAAFHAAGMEMGTGQPASPATVAQCVASVRSHFTTYDQATGDIAGDMRRSFAWGFMSTRASAGARDATTGRRVPDDAVKERAHAFWSRMRTEAFAGTRWVSVCAGSGGMTRCLPIRPLCKHGRLSQPGKSRHNECSHEATRRTTRTHTLHAARAGARPSK